MKRIEMCVLMLQVVALQLAPARVVRAAFLAESIVPTTETPRRTSHQHRPTNHPHAIGPRKGVRQRRMLMLPPLSQTVTPTITNASLDVTTASPLTGGDTNTNGQVSRTTKLSDGNDTDERISATASIMFGTPPPPMDVARLVMKKIRSKDKKSADLLLSPMAVSAVGRLVTIQRLAKRLSLCEFVPALPADNAKWTFDNREMSAQLLVVGSIHDEDGSESLDQLQGQVVLVRGVTQVDNKESLKNWVKHRQFDIKVSSIQPIGTENCTLWMPYNFTTKVRRNDCILASSPPKPKQGPLRFLQLGDLYLTALSTPMSHTVSMVDSLESVLDFQNCVKDLLQRSTIPSLVGIDCEWKPDFLLATPTESQPVLLLQVCLHDLQRVFLLDLQALLRPLQHPSEPLNQVETAIGAVLSELFTSTNILKVGFRLVGDLRRLAASYPHLVHSNGPLSRVEGVVEVSRLSRKVLRSITKERNSRFVSSSLARLVDHHLQMSLNKEQQCSDWSKRPLSKAQVEYAALDAAIGPVILEKHLQHSVHGQPQLQIMTSPLQMGRWKDDASFTESITSWEFVPVLTASYKVPELSASSSRHRRGQYSGRPPFGNLPPVVIHRWITGTR